MKPDELSPKDLYNLQLEAYKAGDFNAVKEMAEIARKRITKPDPENWESVKDKVAREAFPNTLNFYETSLGETHEEKKDIHPLKTYIFRTNVGGYEVEYKYNTCTKCKNVRNKLVSIFNNKNNECFEKWFKWHGEEVKGRDLSEIAEEIFAY
jgi:hypothetical protein